MVVISVMAVVFAAVVVSFMVLAAAVIWNVVGTHRLHSRSELMGARRQARPERLHQTSHHGRISM